MYKILSIFPSVQFSHSALKKDQIDNSNFRSSMIYSTMCAITRFIVPQTVLQRTSLSCVPVHLGGFLEAKTLEMGLLGQSVGLSSLRDSGKMPFQRL